jgi:hypothetical protein
LAGCLKNLLAAALCSNRTEASRSRMEESFTLDKLTRVRDACGGRQMAQRPPEVVAALTHADHAAALGRRERKKSGSKTAVGGGQGGRGGGGGG